MLAPRKGRIARSAAAVTLAFAMLLGAIPAYAEPTATVTPAPAPTAAATTTPAPPRKPVEDKPAVDPTPSTPQTEQFRAELADRQARYDALMAQLDELDRELSVAVDAYNQAVDRLESTKKEVADVEGQLEKATTAYDFQSDILDTRARSIYQEGSFASFEVLLDSKSLNDFVARVKFLNTIGVRDAEIAGSLRGQKELVEKRASELKNAELVAESLEFELRARQIEVLLRIQERQTMLAQAQTDILELLDSEAARRQTEESALLRDILSGASKAGIVVQAGSPVETALSYHGIPYLWGGETPSGFDCSGLVLYVFKQHGVTLPHYSGSQFLEGEKVVPAALAPGDVVFFGSPIHHVGIYIGGGYFIHAPRTGDFVKISRLADRKDYAGARRYPWKLRAGAPTGGVTNPAAAVGTAR